MEQASNGIENVRIEIKMTTIRKTFNWCLGTQEVTLRAHVSQLLVSSLLKNLVFEAFSFLVLSFC